MGIRREGIYYYFKNPTDILLSIVRPNIERLNARMELIAAADLVTEMKEIKHPFQEGMLAQRGFDF